jgi:hypothetical protein
MNKRNRWNLVGVMALGGLLSLASAVVGCGSDPNGGTEGTGTGGKPGGGSGGTSGTLGPVAGMALATFTSDTQGWIVNNYMDASNLGATGSTTAATTTAEWNAAEGSPDSGSLKVSAPFSDWNQYVDVHAVPFDALMLQDWKNKKLHVRIKVASGFVNDMFVMGGAQPYILTGSTYKFGSAWANIPTDGAWKDYVVDLGTMLGEADPSQVIMFGVQIASGMGNAMAAKPTPAVFYIDSVSLE